MSNVTQNFYSIKVNDVKNLNFLADLVHDKNLNLLFTNRIIPKYIIDNCNLEINKNMLNNNNKFELFFLNLSSAFDKYILNNIFKKDNEFKITKKLFNTENSTAAQFWIFENNSIKNNIVENNSIETLPFGFKHTLMLGFLPFLLVLSIP